MENNLQKIRWERDLTEEQLSLKSGVSRSTICQIENKVVVNPTTETSCRLARALGIDVLDLYYDF